MTYKTFYTIYQQQSTVLGSRPSSLTYQQLIPVIEDVFASGDNFIGFVNDDDVTIQFYVNSANDITVDIPMPDKQGSYSKSISPEETRNIIKNLTAPHVDYIDSLALEFNKW